MATSIVFTFIGQDKPGLVEHLSQTVSRHGGNWLESRMSHLAGQFAGITQVQVSDDKVDDLKAALTALSSQELTVLVDSGVATSNTENGTERTLSILGNDRTGIVLEVSRALLSHAINVIEMNTRITSAAMTAEPLFEASARILLPEHVDIEQLSEQLDEIANELAIDISIDA